MSLVRAMDARQVLSFESSGVGAARQLLLEIAHFDASMKDCAEFLTAAETSGALRASNETRIRILRNLVQRAKGGGKDEDAAEAVRLVVEGLSEIRASVGREEADALAEEAIDLAWVLEDPASAMALLVAIRAIDSVPHVVRRRDGFELLLRGEAALSRDDAPTACIALREAMSVIPEAGPLRTRCAWLLCESVARLGHPRVELIHLRMLHRVLGECQGGVGGEIRRSLLYAKPGSRAHKMGVGVRRLLFRLVDLLGRTGDAGEANALYTELIEGGIVGSVEEAIDADLPEKYAELAAEPRREPLLLSANPTVVIVEMTGRWDGVTPEAFDEAIAHAKTSPPEVEVFGRLKREELALNRFERRSGSEPAELLFERTLQEVCAEPDLAGLGLGVFPRSVRDEFGESREGHIFVSHSVASSLLAGLRFVIEVVEIGRRFEVALSVGVLLRPAGALVKESHIHRTGWAAVDRIPGFAALRDGMRDAVQRAGRRIESEVDADWSAEEFHE